MRIAKICWYIVIMLAYMHVESSIGEPSTIDMGNAHTCCSLRYFVGFVLLNLKFSLLIFIWLDLVNCYGISVSEITTVLFHLFVVLTSQSFPHSWLTARFVNRVTRQVPQVEQRLLTLSEHLSSPPVFSEVRVAQSVYCFIRSFFVLFLLYIVLCVLLRFAKPDYPFGIFKLLLFFCFWPM
jgi:hypothetical protein